MNHGDEDPIASYLIINIKWKYPNQGLYYTFYPKGYLTIGLSQVLIEDLEDRKSHIFTYYIYSRKGYTFLQIDSDLYEVITINRRKNPMVLTLKDAFGDILIFKSFNEQ